MSTMTAALPAQVRIHTISHAKNEGLHLGVAIALMTLFLVVAFAGAVAEASGVVLTAGFMTVVVSASLIFRIVKEAIDSNN